MINTQLISPQKVVRGESAWQISKEDITSYCKKPLLLGRSEITIPFREKIYSDLLSLGINPIKNNLKYDCCEEDLSRISLFMSDNTCDGVIAVGGGKVLDAGKLLADRLDLPVITIPLSAATCAGWTALSNIYTFRGAFLEDVALTKAPSMLIFDYEFIRRAPSRTLASGIADALAKWYEASICNESSKDGMVQQAVQMARVLRDQLLIDGVKALSDPYSDSWIRVAEASALTAGLIGGIGGKLCRTAAAHAVHNGLTQLDYSKNSLHGEMVGYGVLVQLCLEEKLSQSQLAGQARRQLLPFLRELSLPVSLEDLGMSELDSTDLEKACDFACQQTSEIHQLPFPVSANDLLEAFSKTSLDHIPLKSCPN